MKISVIGGSGFIGTNLLETLDTVNNDVFIYDKAISKRFPKHTVEGDVRDSDSLSDALKDTDIIYNLAAEHADNVSPLSLYYDVNVGGAENIVTAAEKNNIKRIIFTSTVALYGLNVGIPDEGFLEKPFNDYGKSKWQAEKLFKEWFERDPLNRSLVILRPAVIFGEGNRGNVYNLLNQINSGLFVKVGSGENKKSMGYVKNIADFLSYVKDFEPGMHVYNYSDKPDLTTNEILNVAYSEMNRNNKTFSLPYIVGLSGGYIFDALSKLTKRKFPVSSVRIKKFCANTQISSSKINKTGFKKDYSLEEGLRKFIKHEFN